LLKRQNKQTKLTAKDIKTFTGLTLKEKSSSLRDLTDTVMLGTDANRDLIMFIFLFELLFLLLFQFKVV
jgi:hypothetical protein